MTASQKQHKAYLQKLLKEHQNKTRICIKEFPIEKILPKIKEKENLAVRVGKRQFVIPIKTRMLIFKTNPYCNYCKDKGTTFRLEFGKANRPHLTLYTESGNRLTIDHIKPKSKQGEEHTDNKQVLCYPCNQLKANYPHSKEIALTCKIARKLRTGVDYKILQKINRILEEEINNEQTSIGIH